MRKLLPLILALAGLGAGIGAGIVLRPPADSVEAGVEGEAIAPEPSEAVDHGSPDGGQFDYVRLNNQFVVPIVSEERVRALVVLSLSLEVTPGSSEQIYAREPKLRDGFLRVLFDHANAGGFDSDFTSPTKLGALRTALKELAGQTLGPLVHDVLIIDMVRQDS